MKKYTIEKGYFRDRTSLQIVALFVLFLLYVSAFNATKLFGNRSQIDVTSSSFSVHSSSSLAVPESITSNELIGDIVFMGDTMLARGVGNYIKNGIDPFENVSDVISHYSLRVANIETTIASPSVSSKATKPYTFNAPLESLSTLRKNNIDVSILANDRWSIESPKTLSSFILLAPWMQDTDLQKIFGFNPLEKAELTALLVDLLGGSSNAVLDCVGTPSELRTSLGLLFEQGRYSTTPLMSHAYDNGLVDESPQTTLQEFITLSAKHAIPEILQNQITTYIQGKLA